MMEWLSKLLSGNKAEKQLKKQLKKIKKILNKLRVHSLESAMIEGVLQARHTSARELMVPRVDVFSLDVNLSKKETMKLVAQGNHSRFPVYKENIDNIIGIVHLRDIFKAVVAEKKSFTLLKLINEPYFIPESRPALDVLEDLKKRHLQMAIVVDEYGGFSGVITMEDITEEVVGDVQDEWDDEAETAIVLAYGEHSLDPRLPLKEVSEILSVKLQDDNAETLGGFVINHFGRLPSDNESITAMGLSFQVKTKKKNAIRRIHVKRISPHPTNAGSANFYANSKSAANVAPKKSSGSNGDGKKQASTSVAKKSKKPKQQRNKETASSKK